jgi:hypothetical protein
MMQAYVTSRYFHNTADWIMAGVTATIVLTLIWFIVRRVRVVEAPQFGDTYMARHPRVVTRVQCVCVCVCVRACACVCVFVCVRVRVV